MSAPPILHVGCRNFVVAQHVLALVSADSAPMRRLIQNLRKNGQVIDATQGRKTKSVLFLQNSSVVLSAVSQESLAKRLGAIEVDDKDE